MSLPGAAAVARYTLIEMSRRRLLMVFSGISILLTAGLGIGPLVLPGLTTGDERTVFVLGGISRVDGLVIELCAFAIGMTVINHDLDSGTIVAILAKPVTKLGYATGKLAAALLSLLLLAGVFTGGSMLVVALYGGGHMDVMFWFFAASAANAVLLMVLVMILTVYLNNIVAAAIVVAFNFVQTQITTLHAMIQSGVITDQIFKGLITVSYWGFPHQLLSNLERDITISNVSATCARGCPEITNQAQYLAQLLARVPGASGAGDIVYWFAYLAVVVGILYLAVRRKQV